MTDSIKMYVNRMPEYRPWGGGAKFVNALYEGSSTHGIEIVPATNKNTPIDIIMCVALDDDENGISFSQAVTHKMMVSSHRDVKIIMRVNENDARKGTKHVDDAYVKASQYVDATIFVSEWLKDYFTAKNWKCKKNITVKNGVDQKIFAPGEKLNNAKVNIVAHHWSDNYMKGFDVYDKIDEFVGKHHDEYSFTYIGRHRNTFKNTNVVKPLAGEELGKELGRYDLYVSASRFDPGPNHVLEAISCGLPTLVHVDGGGCVEFAQPGATFKNWDDLEQIITTKDYTRFVKKLDESKSGWDRCVADVAKFVKKVQSK
jgi:glycosyltransferase involved in cell wall biosynthesis